MNSAATRVGARLQHECEDRQVGAKKLNGRIGAIMERLQCLEMKVASGGEGEAMTQISGGGTWRPSHMALSFRPSTPREYPERGSNELLNKLPPHHHAGGAQHHHRAVNDTATWSAGTAP